MSNVKKRHRESNFELLRIIAMFLIVLHHAIYHGVLAVNNTKYPLNSSISFILGMGGRIGVFLFVLISGYFLMLDYRMKLAT